MNAIIFLLSSSILHIIGLIFDTCSQKWASICKEKTKDFSNSSSAKMAFKSFTPGEWDPWINYPLEARTQILDEHAFCINFTTLHMLQWNACITFANRPLFLTYSPKLQSFEWIGKPKGVELTHENLESNIQAVVGIYNPGMQILPVKY